MCHIQQGEIHSCGMGQPKAYAPYDSLQSYFKELGKVLQKEPKGIKPRYSDLTSGFWMPQFLVPSLRYLKETVLTQRSRVPGGL